MSYDIINNYDPDKYLYHYTSMTKAVENIIYKGGKTNFKLKFSKYGESNDPYENYENINPQYYISNEYDDEEFDIDDVKNKIKSFLKNRCYLLSFSIDSNDLVKLKENKKDDSNKLDCRGYGLLRMWSQYGENHRGVCFVFDKNKILEEIKKLENKYYIFNDNMNYENIFELFKPRPYFFDEIVLGNVKEEGIEKYLIKIIEKKYKDIFFNKDNDWKSENEYRIILVSKSVSDNNSNPEIDIKNSLTGLVLGVRMHFLYKDIFINIKKIKKLDINIYQIHQSNREFFIYNIDPE